MRDWGQKRAIVSTAPTPAPKLDFPHVDAVMGPRPVASAGPQPPPPGLGGNPFPTAGDPASRFPGATGPPAPARPGPQLPFPYNVGAGLAGHAINNMPRLGDLASDPMGQLQKGLGTGVQRLGQGVDALNQRLVATGQAGERAQQNLGMYNTAAGSPWLPAGLALGGAGLGALVAGKKRRALGAMLGAGLGGGAGMLGQHMLGSYQPQFAQGQGQNVLNALMGREHQAAFRGRGQAGLFGRSTHPSTHKSAPVMFTKLSNFARLVGTPLGAGAAQLAASSPLSQQALATNPGLMAPKNPQPMQVTAPPRPGMGPGGPRMAQGGLGGIPGGLAGPIGLRRPMSQPGGFGMSLTKTAGAAALGLAGLGRSRMREKKAGLPPEVMQGAESTTTPTPAGSGDVAMPPQGSPPPEGGGDKGDDKGDKPPGPEEVNLRQASSAANACAACGNFDGQNCGLLQMPVQPTQTCDAFAPSPGLAQIDTGAVTAAGMSPPPALTKAALRESDPYMLEPGRAVAATAGRLSALEPALMITPDSPLKWLGGPGKEVDNVVKRYGRARPEELDPVTVHRHGSPAIDDLKNIWNNPRTSPIGKGVGYLSYPMTYAMTHLGRADHYNPFTNAVTSYSGHPEVAAHELGHALNWNQIRAKPGAPWHEQVGKRLAYDAYSTADMFLPRGLGDLLGLGQEGAASYNAKKVMAETARNKDQRNYEQAMINARLAPAYGTYVGGAIPGVGPYIGALGGHIAATGINASNQPKEFWSGKHPGKRFAWQDGDDRQKERKPAPRKEPREEPKEEPMRRKAAGVMHPSPYGGRMYVKRAFGLFGRSPAPSGAPSMMSPIGASGTPPIGPGAGAGSTLGAPMGAPPAMGMMGTPSMGAPTGMSPRSSMGVGSLPPTPVPQPSGPGQSSGMKVGMHVKRADGLLGQSTAPRFQASPLTTAAKVQPSSPNLAMPVKALESMRDEDPIALHTEFRHRFQPGKPGVPAPVTPTAPQGSPFAGYLAATASKGPEAGPTGARLNALMDPSNLMAASREVRSGGAPEPERELHGPPVPVGPLAGSPEPERELHGPPVPVAPPVPPAGPPGAGSSLTDYKPLGPPTSGEPEPEPAGLALPPAGSPGAPPGLGSSLADYKPAGPPSGEPVPEPPTAVTRESPTQATEPAWYDQLFKHISDNRWPYGIGAGALGLGALAMANRGGDDEEEDEDDPQARRRRRLRALMEAEATGKTANYTKQAGIADLLRGATKGLARNWRIPAAAATVGGGLGVHHLAQRQQQQAESQMRAAALPNAKPPVVTPVPPAGPTSSEPPDGSPVPEPYGLPASNFPGPVGPPVPSDWVDPHPGMLGRIGQHFKDNALPYGIGAGALGLGALAMGAMNSENPHRIRERERRRRLAELVEDEAAGKEASVVNERSFIPLAAILGSAAIGAPIGAARAPEGHRLEGTGRGALAGRTAGAFGLGGGLMGYMGGEALANSLPEAAKPWAPAVGAGLGALGGGTGGYNLQNWAMGPPSWERGKHEGKHKSHEKEAAMNEAMRSRLWGYPGHNKAATVHIPIPTGALIGGPIGAYKAPSGHRWEGAARGAGAGFGAETGLGLGLLGGGGLGALAGGGLGYGLGSLSGTPEGGRAGATIGGLLGAGLGGGAGAYHGATGGYSLANRFMGPPSWEKKEHKHKGKEHEKEGHYPGCKSSRKHQGKQHTAKQRRMRRKHASVNLVQSLLGIIKQAAAEKCGCGCSTCTKCGATKQKVRVINGPEVRTNKGHYAWRGRNAQNVSDDPSYSHFGTKAGSLGARAALAILSLPR
jgi:hypothetical protein